MSYNFLFKKMTTHEQRINNIKMKKKNNGHNKKEKRAAPKF